MNIFFIFSSVTPRKILKNLIFLMIAGLFVSGVDFLLAPKRVKEIRVPFQDGQCLYYENTAANRLEIVKEEKCFTRIEGGKFKEQDKFGETVSNTVITYNKDGYTLLAEINDPLFKKVFRSNNPIEQDLINKTKLRNIFYAEPNVKPGTLFYNGHPVKEWVKYNNEETYLVEWNPKDDLFLLRQGPILRTFFKFCYKYNKLIHKESPRQAYEATITRFYYNRSTGILEGTERWLIAYDANGKEIPNSSVLESKSVLIKTNQ